MMKGISLRKDVRGILRVHDGGTLDLVPGVHPRS